jgi:hypothetical protein
MKYDELTEKQKKETHGTITGDTGIKRCGNCCKEISGGNYHGEIFTDPETGTETIYYFCSLWCMVKEMLE